MGARSEADGSRAPPVHVRLAPKIIAAQPRKSEAAWQRAMHAAGDAADTAAYGRGDPHSSTSQEEPLSDRDAIVGLLP
eukprot:SAG11_NODE_35050_length_268_cov_1.532544_1_plen_77_part_01